MELVTARLVLREFTPGDLAAFQAFTSDPRVGEFMEWTPTRAADVRWVLDNCVAEQSAQPRTRYSLAVTERGGAPFGSVELTQSGRYHGDLGYIIGPHQWGRGYATEAAAAMLDFGFSKLGLHRIQATCRPANIASYRVLEKVGMTREGRLREHVLIRGEWQDSLLYAAIARGDRY